MRSRAPQVCDRFSLSRDEQYVYRSSSTTTEPVFARLAGRVSPPLGSWRRALGHKTPPSAYRQATRRVADHSPKTVYGRGGGTNPSCLRVVWWVVLATRSWSMSSASRVPSTFVEYQALYRKYRPQQFDQVIGQDHVTETLAREITEGRVAHAYLFAGPRGTGKTTTARLLAKALNCPNRSEAGEPCDDCASCNSVRTASSMDVIELDAASHNKVEDIRDIRVSVSTVASVGGAKRVFILDEAHMLTKAASNALLKTLEEPPDHVHFVLATTEPYKLLDTIRSRSQRFDFHLINADTLVGHLRQVAEWEGYEASDEALLSVARHAAGSARDGLSLLEQVAALGGGKVTEEAVQRALGLAGRDVYMTLAGAIRDTDAKVGLELIASLASRGVDLRKFLGDAIAFFRGAFLAKYSPNVEDLSDEPAEVIEDWRTVAAQLPPVTVLRAVDVLSEALFKLREGREERLMLELAVLKLTRPELAEDAASLAARIDKLERGGPVQVSPVSVAENDSAPARPTEPGAVRSRRTRDDDPSSGRCRINRSHLPARARARAIR